MNWDRAKTILIAIFLVLDIFLAVVAFGEKQEFGEVSRIEISRAIERAKAGGIAVAADIPRRVVAEPLLSVKPSSMDPTLTVQRLLRTQSPTLQQESPDISVWGHEDKTVVYLRSGTFIYTEKEAGQTTEQITSRQAKTRVDEFLASRGLMPQDARLDFIRQVSPTTHVVQYYQSFQGRPVFGGYITAVVSAQRVDRLRILWFNPIGLGPQKRVVIPATDCLVRVSDVISDRLGGNTTLESIQMGYLSEGIDARQWDAFPVWRFGFSNGHYVYVNGYTGEIEKSEDMPQ